MTVVTKLLGSLQQHNAVTPKRKRSKFTYRR